MLSFACGEETYADMHLGTIEYDCTQTAPCDPKFSVVMDPLNECIRDTSHKLNTGSETFRATYEMRTARCAAYTGCMYFSCASDPNLFSVSRMAQLQYECDQTNACRVSRGEATDSATCFAALANRLDFASVPDKAAWEQRFARCQTQTGCNYVVCQ